MIGDTKVRPRVTESFKRDEKMGIYFKLYNFGPDEKTQKPNGQIEYEVVKNGSNEKIFDFTEDIASAAGRFRIAGHRGETAAFAEAAAGAIHSEVEDHGQEPEPDPDALGPIYGNLGDGTPRIWGIVP